MITAEHTVGEDGVTVWLSGHGEGIEGIRVHMPGVSIQEFLEAARLMEAGEVDAAPAQRVRAAFEAALAPGDGWDALDDAALVGLVAEYRDGETA